ncbi:hypothetical protein GCM10023194_40370 [Planotetraspora phitsanulokensis]|uniref:Uncharacterized protein n=1 Tax=Planotetraspora phitsanulokensis TaxID=575192 RepID=A0A8J3UAG0_9ACTN|nr:hypothetical protein Pph01_59790 [Planotetraspora phitsanulokensis]
MAEEEQAATPVVTTSPIARTVSSRRMVFTRSDDEAADSSASVPDDATNRAASVWRACGKGAVNVHGDTRGDRPRGYGRPAHPHP